MNDVTEIDRIRKEEIRQSPAGRHLTDSQFDETSAIASVIRSRINKAGAYTDKLSHYSYAFARTERFDVLKAEETIRGIYQATYGETMKQTLERLRTRQSEIKETRGDVALRYAHSVPGRISEAPTMPFYRAYDEAAVEMAEELGITQVGAKEMMKEAFRLHEGRELYEAGKEAEALYHKPVHEEVNRSESKPFSRKRQQARD